MSIWCSKRTHIFLRRRLWLSIRCIMCSLKTITWPFKATRQVKFSWLSAFPKICYQAYQVIAAKHGLDPAQMALAYVHSRSFLTSMIIGATNLEQLKHNIESIDITLSEEILEDIEQIHQQYPNPSP